MGRDAQAAEVTKRGGLRRVRARRAVVGLAAALAAICFAQSLGDAQGSTRPALRFGLVSGTSPYSPPSQDEFATMSQAGVDTWRVMFFWPLIQPARDQFDWSSTDADVANAASARVETLPFFLGSPSWLTGCASMVAKCQHEPPVQTQEQRDAWTQFLGEVVRRYGPGGSFWQEHPELPQLPIHSWQIWNEPNMPGFVGGDSSNLASAPAHYAALLTISADAIRFVDPAAQIVLAGLTPGPPHTRGHIARFLDSLYAIPGVKKAFDVVAVHPYSPDLAGIKRMMRVVVRALRRNHDRARVWVTEVGWSSNPPRHSADGHQSLRRGVRGQASMVRRSFHMFLRHRREWRLDRVYYFAWMDIPNGDPTGWAASAGLRRADLSPKPAWNAFLKRMQAYLDE
jgi:hypothetical protein